MSFAQKGRSPLLARIDGLHDGGDWKANGTSEIASDKRKVKSLGGLASRRESSNVCVWGRLTIGYEAHGIGCQIRKTRTGIEGSDNARRRRAEEPVAQP